MVAMSLGGGVADSPICLVDGGALLGSVCQLADGLDELPGDVVEWAPAAVSQELFQGCVAEPGTEVPLQ